jgi:NAD(P)-dependent dehydrogenase (short-subunit alcohol dehydrogenase family)
MSRELCGGFLRQDIRVILGMQRLARRTAAEGVAFLVSDDSKPMTGQTVHVNGGLVLP